jgi:hypothetical protein
MKMRVRSIRFTADAEETIRAAAEQAGEDFAEYARTPTSSCSPTCCSPPRRTDWTRPSSSSWPS